MKTVNSNEFSRQLKSIGRQVLPSPTLAGRTSGFISLAELEQGVEAAIPVFEGMQPGDQFTMVLRNTNNTGWYHIITVDDKLEASAFVPPQDAVEFAGREAELYYYDLVNGVSPSAHFDLGVEYFPAEIDQAIDFEVPFQALSEALTVTLQAWHGQEVGDVLSLYVVARAATVYVVHVEVGPEDIGQRLVIPLPAGVLEASQDGRVSVFYSVLALGLETWGPRTVYGIGSDVGPVRFDNVAVPPAVAEVRGNEKLSLVLDPSPRVVAGDLLLFAFFLSTNLGTQRGDRVRRYQVDQEIAERGLQRSFTKDELPGGYFAIALVVERSGGGATALISEAYNVLMR